MAENTFFMATINGLFLLGYLAIANYAITQWA
jgi:hypothetical protein